jgi:hypothetical protein
MEIQSSTSPPSEIWDVSRREVANSNSSIRMEERSARAERQTTRFVGFLRTTHSGRFTTLRPISCLDRLHRTQGTRKVTGMPRNLNEQQRLELSQLRSQALAFIDFIRPRLDEAIADGMRDGINGAFERGNLKGMRMAISDLNSWLRDLPKDAQEEVKRRIAGTAGVNVDDQNMRELARVRAIEAEGRIRNEEDYYLVKNRLDELGDDPRHAAEAAVLGRLVDTAEF